MTTTLLPLTFNGVTYTVTRSDDGKVVMLTGPRGATYGLLAYHAGAGLNAGLHFPVNAGRGHRLMRTPFGRTNFRVLADRVEVAQ